MYINFLLFPKVRSQTMKIKIYICFKLYYTVGVWLTLSLSRAELGESQGRGFCPWWRAWPLTFGMSAECWQMNLKEAERKTGKHKHQHKPKHKDALHPYQWSWWQLLEAASPRELWWSWCQCWCCRHMSQSARNPHSDEAAAAEC